MVWCFFFCRFIHWRDSNGLSIFNLYIMIHMSHGYIHLSHFNSGFWCAYSKGTTDMALHCEVNTIERVFQSKNFSLRILGYPWTRALTRFEVESYIVGADWIIIDRLNFRRLTTTFGKVSWSFYFKWLFSKRSYLCYGF